MTDITKSDTILSRQLKLLCDAGVKDVVITTGYYDEVLVEYCASLDLPIEYTFVKNPIYDQTNYIYSLYCAREYLEGEDIILMHGDLVFEYSVLVDILGFDKSYKSKTSDRKWSSSDGGRTATEE
jgi:phosphoenolpyruvate phosphomutase